VVEIHPMGDGHEGDEGLVITLAKYTKDTDAN
jgi:hypothetical protein